MNSRIILRLATVAALATGSAIVCTRTAPSELSETGIWRQCYAGLRRLVRQPGRQPHVPDRVLHNRNWNIDVDIPIGPNNKFEPGDPDRGQPTHFMPNRNFGMFTITVPKAFGATERLWWTLAANGVTNRVGMIMSPDFNITPQKSSEEAPNGKYNVPPILKFAESGPAIQDPVATVASAISRTATVNQPMALDLWAEDDALHTERHRTRP